MPGPSKLVVVVVEPEGNICWAILPKRDTQDMKAQDTQVYAGIRRDAQDDMRA